ncbi:uncharacterized protein LOC124166055 [Ischnura elegans]|uniref:uncharacterized protein LOC124166055 n=1 Tax=Ischnura elegans TaxID=197161 RepID=UPI001ED88B15|nr:uncharacterized protein LOC124166055 [Ischnura elegans]
MVSAVSPSTVLLRALALLHALVLAPHPAGSVPAANGKGHEDNDGRSMGGLQQQQRCFVCVPSQDPWFVDDIVRLFPLYPPPPLCDFQPPAPQPEMVRTCPSRHGSCLTIHNGTKISRNCGEMPVVDCKNANKIRYCYCIGDLCNGVHGLSGDIEGSDDEDLGDGSGNGGGGEGSGGLSGMRPPINDDGYYPGINSATAKPNTNSQSSTYALKSKHMSMITLCAIFISIWQ